MLAQLNQPYYYSYYCIYRYFAAARWKYFVKQNTVHHLPNPEAKQELLDIEDSGEIYSVPRQIYHEDKIYEVVSSESINPDYYLIP